MSRRKLGTTTCERRRRVSSTAKPSAWRMRTASPRGGARADHALDPREAQRDAGMRARRGIHVDHAAGHGAAAQIGHELRRAIQRRDACPRYPRRARSDRRRRWTARAPATSAESSRDRSTALSSNTARRGSGRTSVSAPPMTPPIPTGRSASQIISMSGAERALPPVQGGDALAAPRAAHHDAAALEAVPVERVQRLAQLPQHVVGHVHHVVDGRSPTARRRWASQGGEGFDGEAGDHARRVPRAEVGIGDLHRGAARPPRRRLPSPSPADSGRARRSARRLRAPRPRWRARRGGSA